MLINFKYGILATFLINLIICIIQAVLFDYTPNLGGFRFFDIEKSKVYFAAKVKGFKKF